MIVQSGSGGIITGDRLRQRISVADGARAQVCGQGAVSVHRRGADAGAVEELELVATTGGHLENLAEPRLLHDDSDLEQHTRVELGQGTVLTVESVVVIGERCNYDSTLEVRVAGRLLARERTRFTGADLPAGTRAVGLLVLAGSGPSAPVVHEAEWVQWERAAAGGAAYGAVSRLPHGAGLAVRVAARDGAALRDAMDRAIGVVHRADGAPEISPS
ncbi:urease accessory protein UreD [Nocardioides zeae]|uniref:urease accessory protein UreD n=1 Tax=Nocardioides zeae TaxID=1457234 RepID=UPI0027D7D0D8|nr:urease accessory protein UreD [Nocardioides zeae]